MHILYDGFIYQSQKAGGISRYFTNIIDQLPADWEPAVSYYFRQTLRLPEHPRLQWVPLKELRLRPYRFLGQPIDAMLNTVYNRPRLEKLSPRLLHPTYYTPISPGFWEKPKAPMVITVYDMLHELHMDKMDANQAPIPAAKKKMVEAAAAILCISENTRQDLLQVFPNLPKERVFVTHLATEMTPEMAQGSEPVPDFPYLLYIGDRNGYKNFQGFIRSFASLGAARRDVHICVVGGGFSADEERTLTDLGIRDVVHHLSHVDDARLARLYQHSLALVYPSVYEGFGIPPLEAMSCGTLVIAADSSSIPEVVGEAGLLFQPDDPDGLTDRLRAVIDSTIDREAYLRAGALQAKKFSWERTAAETIAVYKKLVG